METLNELINKSFARISTILGIFLAIKYLVRLCMQKNKNKGIYSKLNKCMKNSHKIIGITLIITGMIHGIFSTTNLFSFNMGTICWIVSILLGLIWMFRNKICKSCIWIKYHRTLSILFLLALIGHVIEIKI